METIRWRVSLWIADQINALGRALQDAGWKLRNRAAIRYDAKTRST
jgi:hypothetical protein